MEKSILGLLLILSLVGGIQTIYAEPMITVTQENPTNWS